MLSFSEALEELKNGRMIRRSGWNGKNMFLFLVPGSKFLTNKEPLLTILGENVEVNYHAHIDMFTAQGYVVPWLASQADLLDEDWEVVPA